MKEKKILYISSEMMPYLPETRTSKMSFEVARKMNSKGAQIRVFMPRFGVINERRHQLHEVIRLSGMNLIINDIDMPLIIKVASVPKERMQVYFIDNEEYFKRKAVFTNEDNELFEDNDERAIFFAKGVIETVKKLNWSPDIIHIQGWMAALVPLYLKEYFKNDALFTDSKVVVSVFNEPFEGNLNEDLINKVDFDGIDKEKIELLKTPNFNNLLKIAIENADAVIQGSEELPEELENYLKNIDKPVLNFHKKDEFSQAYLDFYNSKVL
ncbi:MAG: glycogen/starch synthase [Bacteroidales bacterium]|nr:glycogen/starch synthase [Bacteroidales bacterium]